MGKALTLLAVLVTIWGVTYMHDRDHRYDIVAAGSSGNGGNSSDPGSPGSVEAYVIDHQTGEVWYHHAAFTFPMLVKSCEDLNGTEIEHGCVDKKSAK